MNKLSPSIGNLSKGLKIGQSVAVNGVCLTITKLNGSIAEFSVIGETVRKKKIWHPVCNAQILISHSPVVAMSVNY